MRKSCHKQGFFKALFFLFIICMLQINQSIIKPNKIIGKIIKNNKYISISSEPSGPENGRTGFRCEGKTLSTFLVIVSGKWWNFSMQMTCC